MAAAVNSFPAEWFDSTDRILFLCRSL